MKAIKSDDRLTSSSQVCSITCWLGCPQDGNGSAKISMKSKAGVPGPAPAARSGVPSDIQFETLGELLIGLPLLAGVLRCRKLRLVQEICESNFLPPIIESHKRTGVPA